MPDETFKWDEPALLINSKGTFRWPGIACYPVKDAISTLEAFAKAQPQRLKACFTVDDKPVDLVAQGSQAILVYTLDKLHLNTWWTRSGDRMVPNPAMKAKNVGFQASTVWQVPTDMRLVYGACVTWNSEKWTLIQAVLFAQSKSGKKKGNLLPPLPNIYTDGRMCLLSADCDNILPSARTLAEMAPLCLSQFQNTEWNSELTYDSNRLAYLVQFNPANLSQYPVPDNWYEYCTMVNNTTMEAICN